MHCTVCIYILSSFIIFIIIIYSSFDTRYEQHTKNVLVLNERCKALTTGPLFSLRLFEGNKWPYFRSHFIYSLILNYTFFYDLGTIRRD